MLTTIAKLIAWMRDCGTLLGLLRLPALSVRYLYKTQERHQECSRVVKAARAGNGLPTNAPEPPPTGDPQQLETWQLELYVYERLIRQLKMVGDGFAWTCFGYDRRPILTLSRNQSSGLSYGKLGLYAELAAIDELWKTEGHFALHHDQFDQPHRPCVPVGGQPGTFHPVQGKLLIDFVWLHVVAQFSADDAVCLPGATEAAVPSRPEQSDGGALPPVPGSRTAGRQAATQLRSSRSRRFQAETLPTANRRVTSAGYTDIELMFH